MQRRDAEATDRLAVLGGRVAHVLGELPSGMRRVGPVHVAVTRLLGQHGGGRDRRALRVAADDRPVLVGQTPDGEAVAEAHTSRPGHERQRVA